MSQSQSETKIEKKKVINHQTFLTRSEKMKKVLFPLSDENRVIVMPNKEGIGFKFNCYNHEYLSEQVDKFTFDNTVRNAQQICQHVWQQRKMQETTDTQANSKYYLMAAYCLSIISFIMLSHVIYNTQNMNTLIASITLNGFAASTNNLIIITVLTLFVAFQTLFIVPKFIDLEEQIINKLSHYLDSENEHIYTKKNLKWEMHPKFYWLELHIIKLV